MKRLMICIGIASLLLSACGTITININPGVVTATSAPSQSDKSELDWITLTGILRDSNGAPLAGESVFCQQDSTSSVGLCTGTIFTGADGRFSFGPVLLHATDSIVLWAIPSSYELQQIKRLGADVWKQPDFEFIFSVKPTPSSSPLSTGDLGWITISGTVRDASGAPLMGKTVACQDVSGNPKIYSNRVTNTRGGYSCDAIFLRDTDRISVQVIAGGFADQNITRSGPEIQQNPIFDFVFSKQVTPTP